MYNLINVRVDSHGAALVTDMTGEQLHGVEAVTVRVEANKRPFAVLQLCALDVEMKGLPTVYDAEKLTRDLVASNQALRKLIEADGDFLRGTLAAALPTATEQDMRCMLVRAAAEVEATRAQIAAITAERDELLALLDTATSPPAQKVLALPAPEPAPVAEIVLERAQPTIEARGPGQKKRRRHWTRNHIEAVTPAIQRYFETTHESAAAIARRFQVSKSHVQRVANDEKWQRPPAPSRPPKKSAPRANGHDAGAQP